MALTNGRSARTRPNGSALRDLSAASPMRAHTKVDNDSLTSDSEIGTGDEKALERILERYSAAHGLASIDLAPFLAPDYDPQTYANLIIEPPQSASPVAIDEGDDKDLRSNGRHLDQSGSPLKMGARAEAMVTSSRRLLDIPAASSSSKAIDVEGDVSIALGRLNLAIDDIDRLIRDEVTANAHDLLAHTTSLLAVRPTLTTLRSALDALSAHRDKLVQRIAVPHAALRQAAQRQAKIRQAQSLVRRAERFVRLVRRLQIQMDALMAAPPRGASTNTAAANDAKRLGRLGEEGEGEAQQQAGVADEDLVDDEAGEQRGRGLARAALSVSEIINLVHTRPDRLSRKPQEEEDGRQAQRTEEGDEEEELIPLTSLDVVNACLPLVERSREKVTDLMEDMVVMGLRDLSPLLLSTSLQTAFNLGQLADLVRDLLADLTDVIRDRVKAACDMSSLSRELGGSREPQIQQPAAYASYRSRRGAGGASDSPASQSATAQRWSKVLWARFETLIVNEMGAVCSKVYTLERVLSLKTDKASGRNYLDDAMQILGDRPSAIFWSTLSGALDLQVREATRTSSFFSTTLSSGYPRLLRLFQEFFVRVSVYTDSVYTHAQQSPETIAVLRSVSHLERSYLVKTSSRLDGIIASSLAPDARQLPTTADGEGLARIAIDEIDGARFDPLLLIAVVNTVKDGIRRALNAIQSRHINDSSAYTLQTASTTAAQSLNAGLTSFTYHLLMGLQTLAGSDRLQTADINAASITAPRVVEEKIGDLFDQVHHIYEAQQRDPLLSHLKDEINESLNKMHYVDFGQPVPDAVSGSGSAYMVELSEKLWFVREQLFSRYDIGWSERASWTLQVTKYALERFAWQASLLHPLGEGGKLKLTSDMTELEFAASQLLASVGGGGSLHGGSTGGGGGLTTADCGDSFKALRIFRPMLFYDLAKFELKDRAAPGEDGELDEQREGDKLLRASSGLNPLIVAHHLLGRCNSRAKKGSKVFPWQLLDSVKDVGKTRQEYLSFIEKESSDSVSTKSSEPAMSVIARCIDRLRAQEQVHVDEDVLRILEIWVRAHQA